MSRQTPAGPPSLKHGWITQSVTQLNNLEKNGHASILRAAGDWTARTDLAGQHRPAKKHWIAQPQLRTLPVIGPGGPGAINKKPDMEAVLRVAPDLIFIDGGGLPMVAEDHRKKPNFYRALSAFRSRRVFALLPFNSYTTNIGTAMVDAFAIGKILYPSRFDDVDLAKQADGIYAFLVGLPVYDQMAADHGQRENRCCSCNTENRICSVCVIPARPMYAKLRGSFIIQFHATFR